MAFGSQNLLMGAGLAGVALAMTAVIVPYMPQMATEAERTVAAREEPVSIPSQDPDAPPPERSERAVEVQRSPAPVEVPLAVVIPPEPAPRQESRIPDPSPIEVPTTAAVTPIPDIRVASHDDTPMDCLPEGLKRILKATALRFESVEVVSTTHLHTDNHNAGRAKIHADCMAADIRTKADTKEVVAFVRTLPGLGGIEAYKNGVIHLDDASAHPPDAYAKRPLKE